MAKKRDTNNYNLKDDKKIVYKGTTNDLEKREVEHRADGKKFTHIQKVDQVKTANGADKEETKTIIHFIEKIMEEKTQSIIKPIMVK